MPNGHANDPNYKNEIAELEAFFAPVSELMGSFAKAHNLLLEKYYHDFPTWSVCFSHPSEGTAKIDVTRAGKSLSVIGMWWVDVYETGTRYTKHTTALSCEAESECLRPLIEKTFLEVMSFAPGNWLSVTTGFKTSWAKIWTKEQFELMSQRWPRAVL